MRTETTALYTFEELTAEAQEIAARNLYDINVDFDWWENVYYDAKQIGIKINGFDIDRGSYCKINFTKCADDIAAAIMREHGEVCETHKTASQFMKDRNKLVEKYSDGVNLEKVTEENEYEFDNDLDELENEFKKELANDYLSILRNEYEYLTSEEAIRETIIANEIEFNSNGNRWK